MALIAQLVIGCSDDASEPTQPVSDVDRAPTIGIWPNAHERVPPPGDLCAYLLTLEQQADEFRARVAESNVTALTIPITWSSVDPGDGSGPDY